MKDHIEELSNLFKNSKLPMPSAVDLADRTLAAEMGIDLETVEVCYGPRVERVSVSVEIPKQR